MLLLVGRGGLDPARSVAQAIRGPGERLLGGGEALTSPAMALGRDRWVGILAQGSVGEISTFTLFWVGRRRPVLLLHSFQTLNTTVAGS